MSGDGKRSAGHRPQATAPILNSTIFTLEGTRPFRQQGVKRKCSPSPSRTAATAPGSPLAKPLPSFSPNRGMGRAIGRGLALRNDALQPMPLSRLQQLHAVVKRRHQQQARYLVSQQRSSNRRRRRNDNGARSVPSQCRRSNANAVSSPPRSAPKARSYSEGRPPSFQDVAQSAPIATSPRGFSGAAKRATIACMSWHHIPKDLEAGPSSDAGQAGQDVEVIWTRTRGVEGRTGFRDYRDRDFSVDPGVSRSGLMDSLTQRHGRAARARAAASSRHADVAAHDLKGDALHTPRGTGDAAGRSRTIAALEKDYPWPGCCSPSCARSSASLANIS